MTPFNEKFRHDDWIAREALQEQFWEAFPDLSVRAANALRNADIRSIDDLIAAFLKDGADVYNLGAKSRIEVGQAIIRFLLDWIEKYGDHEKAGTRLIASAAKRD